MAFNFRGETTINNPYADLGGYQSAYQQLFDQGVGMHADSGEARQQWAGRLNSVGDQFKTLWTNMVGRAPTEDELNQFFSQNAGNIITNSPNGRSESDSVNVRNQIAQYVGDSGQKAAQDYATQGLQSQQSQANDLASLFRTQGHQAINSTEAGLLDYQQRLFERLRPNLITSLQSQGLLNSGGLNQAMAGAQGDLATAAQGSLLDANMNVENQANAIAYGGAAAPYLFQQQQYTNQPNFLQQNGTDALNKAFQTYTQNLNYQQQLGLTAYANHLKNDMPSLTTMFGRNAAQSGGTAVGQDISPFSAIGKMGGASNAAGGMAAFA